MRGDLVNLNFKTYNPLSVFYDFGVNHSQKNLGGRVLMIAELLYSPLA